LPPDSHPAALLLAPETPYPMAGGGALRTASLLHYLAQTHHVDLLVFRQPGAPDPADSLPAALVRRVFVLDLPPNRRSLAARTLRNAGRVTRQVPPLVDRFSGFGASIAGLLEGRRYQIGVVEHFWCAPYWEQIAPLCDRTVLNLHNIESELHQRCARADGSPAAFAHRIFHHAARDLERHWLPCYSQVLTASESDAALARAVAPRARIAVYPNAIPATPLPPATGRGNPDAIVFSGNFEYHPNHSAVRFFRREVWPLVRNRWPELVWRLVGKNPDAVRNFTSGDPRIQVVGAVDDAVRELARARIAVAPLLAGSGTRFKIIEAWAAGLPVVSTRIGAEGLPAHDADTLLLADSPAAFAGAISRLLASPALCQTLGMRGRMLVEEHFTWEAAWKLLEILP